MSGRYKHVIYQLNSKFFYKYHSLFGFSISHSLQVKHLIEITMPPHIWTAEEEETLLQLLEYLINAGGLRRGDFKLMEVEMEAAFPQQGIAANVIEGKIKAWKRTYHRVRDLICTPGFGWDQNENKFIVEEEGLWNEFVQVSYILHFSNLHYFLKDFSSIYCSFM